ncbi:PLP-dependent aminotransferase family protein [Adlercreutzia sp. ZJ304]|uniref:MocR-like pyridoxine biosynthesis transcription factor PdxR n=1 Tax=Adlercreutzia sp. ZJ304 TaxID=2709791 RepID=UPI0013ECD087
MQFDENSTAPLYMQIFDHFRTVIENNAISAGQKLPSIRGLATQIDCSRNTVESAYRMLVQEGYAISRRGSGYIVQDASILHATPKSDTSDNQTPEKKCYAYDFTYGNLQKGTFPTSAWRSFTDDVLMSIEKQIINEYTDPLGEITLRREIAFRLNSSRDIHCIPEQVIIQGGTQPSVQNLMALFDRKHDTVLMEDPGYDGTRKAFQRSGFEVKPCRVDNGTTTFLSDVMQSGAKLAYVTPSSQFPTCQAMPLDVRNKMVQWALENDAYILEDDYCREFRYRERPAPPFASLDHQGRVIYMGTFSKTLSPTLRMNYLVLPLELLKKWEDEFGNSYSAVPWLMQETLARFMHSGQWDRHLRRIQSLNKRKYETLLDSLWRCMGQRIAVRENGTGLHVLIDVLDGRTPEELIELAMKENVRVYNTQKYCMLDHSTMRSCILIGFSAIPEEDIEPGIKALSRAWF